MILSYTSYFVVLSFLSFFLFSLSTLYCSAKAQKLTKSGICLPKEECSKTEEKQIQATLCNIDPKNYFRKPLPRPHGTVQGAREHYHLKQRKKQQFGLPFFTFADFLPLRMTCSLKLMVNKQGTYWKKMLVPGSNQLTGTRRKKQDNFQKYLGTRHLRIFF